MPSESVGQQLRRTLPPSLTGIRFVDSTGRSVTLAGLRGKIVVISDMLTLCQGTCPLDTADVVGAARRVQAAGLGGKVVFLSVTVDPQRDVTRRLVAYRKQYSPAPPDWLVLTGPAGDVNRFWDTLGVFRKRVADEAPGPRDWLTGRHLTYDITHSDEVFFLDSTGRERFLLQGVPHISPGSPVPPRLKAFVAAGDEPPPAGADGWTTDQAVQVLSWLLDAKI
jgi:protein SCO1/2